jgi:uncharacterized membrane-anchored protein
VLETNTTVVKVERIAVSEQNVALDDVGVDIGGTQGLGNLVQVNLNGGADRIGQVLNAMFEAGTDGAQIRLHRVGDTDVGRRDIWKKKGRGSNDMGVGIDDVYPEGDLLSDVRCVVSALYKIHYVM